MINTEYVRVKMSKCLSSFVQATAVHFFSVKLLKKIESSKGIKQAAPLSNIYKLWSFILWISIE